MPRYHRIYLVLRQKILSGIYDEGGLPAEFSLMELYCAAWVTIRRALSELSNEGLIFRRAGRALSSMSTTSGAPVPRRACAGCSTVCWKRSPIPRYGWSISACAPAR
ncbi:GntR family transcriptional regulator [Cupriavidus necator]|uniref:GntR family transcriptional regulator n=1 Tax=Cupriavidus necator TaxID=106590 RepID=UPI001E45FE74|nr:GntR family transcriptional regulator [Cupriavidus necator]